MRVQVMAEKQQTESLREQLSQSKQEAAIEVEAEREMNAQHTARIAQLQSQLATARPRDTLEAKRRRRLDGDVGGSHAKETAELSKELIGVRMQLEQAEQRAAEKDREVQRLAKKVERMDTRNKEEVKELKKVGPKLLLLEEQAKQLTIERDQLQSALDLERTESAARDTKSAAEIARLSAWAKKFEMDCKQLRSACKQLLQLERGGEGFSQAQMRAADIRDALCRLQGRPVPQREPEMAGTTPKITKEALAASVAAAVGMAQQSSGASLVPLKIHYHDQISSR